LIPSLGRILRPRTGFRIVVVDDGSRDETQAVLQGLAKEWPLQVLRHKENQGYGVALKTGFLWIARNAKPSDSAVSMDADNTHLPEYIPALLDKLDEGFDVATASYWRKGGRIQGVPFKRRVMSWVVNLLFHLRTPVHGARCFTNGFRAYRVGALQKALDRYGDRFIEQTGFPGGAELFLKVTFLGAQATEVPFVLHYQNRGASSKIRIGQTIRGYLRLLKDARAFYR
jgi:dolichol-phosphate mannosyltransferase